MDSVAKPLSRDQLIGRLFSSRGEVVALLPWHPSVIEGELFRSTCGDLIADARAFESAGTTTWLLCFHNSQVTRRTLESVLERCEIDTAYARKNCKAGYSIDMLATSLNTLSAYKLFDKESGLYLHGDVPKRSAPPSFSLDRETLISKSIKAGDTANTNRLIDLVCRENTIEKQLSLEMADRLSAHLQLMFVRFMAEGEIAAEPPLLRALENQLSQLGSCRGSGSFFTQIKITASTLCHHYQGLRHSHRERLVENIRNYIDASFTRHDMGLQAVSTHFSLTPEYISTIFRDGTGHNFSEYVESLRINKARSLITTTDFPIMEIGRKCGYSTAITFRRAFKRVTGSSPSEFRIECRNRLDLESTWVFVNKYVAKELIFAHTDPPNGIREQTAQEFAELVGIYTNGQYSVKTYPESLLGYDTKLLELVAAGAVDLVVAGLSIYAQYMKEMILLLSPFTISDLNEGINHIEHSVRIQYMFHELQTSGFTALCFWDRGFRCLSSTRPVIAPEDADGLRIRVPPNPLHTVLWSNLGAHPLPMEIKDVYDALRNGEIDAQENPISTIWVQRFFEVAPHLTLTRHMYSPLLMTISSKSWATIPEKQQHAIERAAREASRFAHEKINASERRMLNEMKSRGCHVYEPDLQEWRRAMRRGGDEFCRRYGLDTHNRAQSFAP